MVLEAAQRSHEDRTVGGTRERLDKHPGLWRQGNAVVFKYRDARGRQHWAKAPTVTEAKRLREAIRTDVARGEYRAVSRERFADYARAWVETYAGRTRSGIREVTLSDYRARLETKAIPYFGTIQLAAIEPQDIKAFAAHLAAEGLRPNSVRLALAPVKLVLATAFEEGRIRINPAAGVRIATPRPTEDTDAEGEERVKALTEPELRRIISEMPPDWRPFFWLLADTGLRWSEIVELRWKDVDLAARTLVVRRSYSRGGRVGPPKSRYGRRTLRLSHQLAKALWELRKTTRATESDLVFATRSGDRLGHSNVSCRVLKPAAQRAGVGWVTFHTFRHTCATILFRRGWNAVQVQRWLGHHSPSFTLASYVHLLPEDLPEPISAVADIEVGITGLSKEADAGRGSRQDVQPTDVLEASRLD